MDQTSPVVALHGAMSVTTSPSAAPTTDEVLEEFWREVGRIDPGPSAPRQRRSRMIVPLPSLVVDPRADAPLPLDAIVALDGAAFVRAAYAAVLGRVPDEAGEAAVLAALAAGDGKVAIVGSLSLSPEGQAAGRIVPGLRTRALAQTAYRVPVLGRLARFGAAILRRLGVSRGVAAISMVRHGPALMRREVEAQAASLGARIEALHTMHVRSEQAYEAVLADMAEQLDAVARTHAAARRADEQILRQLTADIGELRRKTADFGDLGRKAASAPRRQDDKQLAQAVAELRAEIDREAQAVTALRAVVDGQAPGQAQTIARTEAMTARLAAAIAEQQRRIGDFLAELRQAAPMEAAALAAEEDQHSLDGLYIALEDKFRGTREDIKARQRVYLPDLRAAGAGTPARPIIDVGCGRGELLELLRDEGLTARGVDLNGAFADLTRSLGLDVTDGDAVAYLRSLPPASVGAVTGFHIIEHLPYRTMVALLDAALSALAPGGTVIFETPNPNNLQVASRTFRFDPTHRHPLPPELTETIARARGYVGVTIRELHPMNRSFVAEDALLGEQLDGLFHGCMDYALIAKKP